MVTENTTKINQLMQIVPPGVVLQASWLTDKGYSTDLQKYYRKSGWLRSFGTGAMVRLNEEPGYEGGLYALQKQSGLSVHVGGRSALALLGKAHYLEMNKATASLWLFGGEEERLPAWFRKHNWAQKIMYRPTSFLPQEKGLVDYAVANFSIKVSGPARAILECLYLAPEKFDLVECYELLENLNDLRPGQVQELLELCGSVKVKRLFLFMAEQLGHSWFKLIKMDNIDLGKGKRSIAPGGSFVPKYQITVPSNLIRNEQ
ncbi:MAG: hypothetical protein B7Y11_12835 [Sphingobacteriia bacterium 24-36-13]|jgi:hypothetical protein|uniref:type IV toxin-antitoxin system AbiEi family antitoxin n=1 Tax=Sediminibacterium sp. TaxID=1917865 RepID=UPI000BD7675A|nr:type IV toxin-antitoxin system AbiEi family antitoxin [Sediminibacterium sp.]OYZ52007.1 MAG: hypothetical protein B7Y11_12835 [Sphingobacteriia bacterium 24-36-13]OZA65023.1 MAG: hypothetical protein B7X68_05155 [Sphingobacteriia bacterium 39-36-14]HQS35837.1 type IV toxin-antitoxin system AbiEi family antitoxin [Sediminibacterium sp.]